VRDEYNYAGADVAVRIETSSSRLTPGADTDVIVWSAAAKPFGTLENGVQPNRYGLVLPAFTDVRLIPIDASSAPAPGSRPGWATHVYEHLPEYEAFGPASLDSSCWYCRQLQTWEDLDFRRSGLNWLALNSDDCHSPGSGGGPGGGSRRPH